MDFQSAMETFAEAWVAANTKSPHHQPHHPQEQQTQAISLTTSPNRSPSLPPPAAPLPPMLGSRGPEASPTLGQSLRSSSPASRKSSSSPAHQTLSSNESAQEGINLSPNSKEAIEARKSGKSIPVHCVVEVLVPEDGPHPRRSRAVVETDSYAIIPVITPFEELVHVALYRLGYPQDCAHLATGSVVIKNWKPLRLERIADSPLLTVGDILGELTTVATLRIQIIKSRHSAVLDIKDKLLRLLLLQSHNLLLSSGCPLDESFLSQICRGQSPSSEPTEETRRRFDQWLALHHQHAPPGALPLLGGGSAGPPPSHPSPSLMGHSPSLGQLPRPTPHFGDHRRLPHSPSKLDALSQHGMPEHLHPALQTVQSQYPTQKTRMRTSFDPELELPKLQRWFAENQHPSRHQIQQYVKELNALESRRGRKPLDVNNVVYWFKNARAAQKRAELRLHLNGYSNGPLPLGAGLNPNHHMHLGGGVPLMKSPMSHHDGSISEGDDGDIRRSQHPMQTSPYSLVTSSRNSLLSHLTRGREDEESDDEDMEEEDSSNPTPSRNSTSPHPIVMEPPSSEPLQLTTSKDVPVEVDDDHETKKDIKEESFKEEMSDEDERPPSSMSPRPNTAPSSLNPSSPTNEEEIHRPTTPNSDFGAGALVPRTPNTPLDRGFPLVPNNMFSHSIMYMSHYIPGLQQHVQSAAAGLNLAAAAAAAQLAAAASADDRRKRNRTFIDPVTEVPRLEQWFSLNTHPSHNLILKYTEELNRMPYRQKFPKLEPKNVQFWFKNRRAKCKRLKMSL